MKKLSYRLLAVNTMVWVTTALYAPFIGSYYAQNGISSFQIGVLMAIGPIVSIFVQPVWAYLSDRLGRRRNVLTCISIGSGITILLYLGKPDFKSYILATFCMTVFQTAILPLSDAIITHLSAKNNVNFAYIRMGGTIGYAVTALILGNFLKEKPESIFLLGSMGFVILTLFLRMLPDEKKEKQYIRNEEKRDRHIFQNRMIYFVLFLAFIIQLGMSFAGTFYSVYVISLGYGQSIVGLSSCISAMSEVPILYVANKLIKKFGAVQLLIFSVVMMSVRLFLAGSGYLPLMLVSQLLQSVTYMTSYYSCVVFISENVLEGKISQGQSCLAIVQAGLGAVVGSIAGGMITNRIGIASSFMVMSVSIFVIGLVNLGIFYFYSKKQRKKVLYSEI